MRYLLLILISSLMVFSCTPEEIQDEPTPEVEVIEAGAEVIGVGEPTGEWVSLGTYTLTAYCPCTKCCGQFANGITSTGVTARELHTIAVDPKVIPYGTEVLIDGIIYTAEDCGGAIKNNRIDVYFDSHQEALNFGRQRADVYVKVVN